MADKFPIEQVAKNVVANIEQARATVGRQLARNVHGHPKENILKALGEKAQHVESWLTSAEAVVAPVVAAVATAVEVAVSVSVASTPVVEPSRDGGSGA